MARPWRPLVPITHHHHSEVAAYLVWGDMQEVTHQVGHFPFPCHALVGHFRSRAVPAHINTKLDLCRNRQRSVYAKSTWTCVDPPPPRSVYTKVQFDLGRVHEARLHQGSIGHGQNPPIPAYTKVRLDLGREELAHYRIVFWCIEQSDPPKACQWRVTFVNAKK